MNILVLTPLVPYPPHDGDKLRLYHFLKFLKSRGHKIDLFCLTRVKSDFQFASDLGKLCRSVRLQHLTNFDLFFNLVGGVLLGQSLNVSSHFSPELRDALKAYWETEKGKSIDVVLAHRLRMAPAAFEYNPGKPVVLELTDSLTAYTELLREQPGVRFSRKTAAWWDYWFLRREEAEWSEKTSKSVIISEPDAQVLKELDVPAAKIAVIPNGVEIDSAAKAKRPDIYPTKCPVVCFVGNMGYAPNEEGALWFLNEVWPLVKKKVPAAVFAAVGGQPRKVLKKFHNGDDVLVTGWVPEIEPYVRHADVSIAPLRVAAGMQNKVALSMALGVPVISTSSAAAWMPPRGRECLWMAETEELFAGQIINALLKPKKARLKALKGKRFILKNYRWNESGRKLEDVLKLAVKAGMV